MIGLLRRKFEYDEYACYTNFQILLYQSVDFNDIKHIVTANDNVKIKLEQIGLKIPVYLVPKMFFRNE